MNIGTVFAENGRYVLFVKLGADGWSAISFDSPSEVSKLLLSVGVPVEEAVDFCSLGLSRGGKLAPLPGRTDRWVPRLNEFTRRPPPGAA